MANLDNLTYDQIKELRNIVRDMMNVFDSSLKERAEAMEIAKPIFDAFEKAYNKKNGIDAGNCPDDSDF